MKFASHEPPEVSPFGGDVAARRQRGYLCNPSRRSAPPSLKGRALGSALRKAANFNVHEYISYQIKSNRALFFCQMLGCIVFCAQFFIMGAYTGAISLIINIVRNVLLLKSNVWKWAKSKVTLCYSVASGHLDRIYMGRLDQLASICFCCCDHIWILDAQCAENPSVTVIRISLHTCL